MSEKLTPLNAANAIPFSASYAQGVGWLYFKTNKFNFTNDFKNVGGSQFNIKIIATNIREGLNSKDWNTIETFIRKYNEKLKQE